MEVVRKPKELSAKDKVRANVAKNCLIVTLMSLERRVWFIFLSAIKGSAILHFWN